jgi:hypothetical protein
LYSVKVIYSQRLPLSTHLGVNKEINGQMLGENSFDIQSALKSDTDPYAILEECRQVDRDLDALNYQLDQLELNFKKAPAQTDLSKFKLDIRHSYCTIVNNIDRLRSRLEADSERNVAQVRRVVLRLKATIQRYEFLLAEFRRDSEQAARR